MIAPPGLLESKKGSNTYHLPKCTKLRRMTFDFLRVLQERDIALTTFIPLNWEFYQKKKPKLMSIKLMKAAFSSLLKVSLLPYLA